MSDTVSVAKYQNLITNEHSAQPNFLATIAASCQPFVDAQNLLLGMPDLYNVQDAVGVQLDAVGLWVGATRYVAVPLNAFFSWNIEGLGWNQGIWHTPGTPTTGFSKLDDETFRLLILARIIADSWDGTIAGAMPALSELFSGSATPGTVLTLQDNMNMTMTLTISGQSPGAVFAAIITSGELGLKPVGVEVIYNNIST